jgi:hypothetical protein
VDEGQLLEHHTSELFLLCIYDEKMTNYTSALLQKHNTTLATLDVSYNDCAGVEAVCVTTMCCRLPMRGRGSYIVDEDAWIEVAVRRPVLRCGFTVPYTSWLQMNELRDSLLVNKTLTNLSLAFTGCTSEGK